MVHYQLSIFTFRLKGEVDKKNQQNGELALEVLNQQTAKTALSGEVENLKQQMAKHESTING